jgi:D-3-phosphoglycerate dehydrogenase
MSKPKILVTCEMSHLHESRGILDREADVTYQTIPPMDKFLEIIPQYDALVTNLQQRISKEVIDKAVNLKCIATPSTGTDHIDVEYAESKGIEVQSSKKDYDVLKNITSTAEHAFMLMMASLRQLPFAFDTVRNGNWNRDDFLGREVQGRTVGIVGYGRLGEMFSRFAKGFDMKVLAADPEKEITDPWVTQVTFDELLKKSEIITIHVHLTPKTENMLSTREFSLMQEGTFLVNTSRGGLIDEEALLAALNSGKIRGAAVDVLANELDGNIDSEPLVKYARTHTNLIITPHIGGRSLDSQEKAYRHMAGKLIAFLKND